tara:strand:+ start:230 stop:1162 length:933 start_codon:yes stop_codon:yes gene_type:complete
MARTTQKSGLDRKVIESILSDKINIFSFLSYREFLEALYLELKSSLKKYSYNKFSEDLGLSNSNVAWMIITGRRKLTTNNLQKLVPALGLKGKPRQYLVALVKHNNSNQPEGREKHFRHLIELRGADPEVDQADTANLQYFAEWYYPIIREMTALGHCTKDYESVANQVLMKVLPKQVEKALSLLEKLDLVAHDQEAGIYQHSGEQIFPDKTVGQIATVRFHERMCDLAKEAVTRVPAEEREMNVLTVALSEDHAGKAAKIIYEAAEQIFRLEQESKQAERVYQVNLQLFPVTRKNTKTISVKSEGAEDV